ncbi:MAG: threonine/serine dehydratase [Chloracidobacterium sp.]|nr:threonine/serine dehydratase [Chloracidobacterium sp.]
MPGKLLRIDAIREARERIKPYIRRTPIERSRTLSEILGAEVYVKYEMFQKTGSFKVRGAFNKLLSVGPDGRAGGVVAVSGGNHAQAIAYAGSVLGIEAVVIMPESTPETYINATRGYGAVIDLQPTIAAAFERVEKYRSEGMIFVHPFNDPEVMAGQGTLGLEICDDVPEVTDVLVSIGGGGLAGGVSTAVKAESPGTRIWGVETEGADAMAKALVAGRPVELPAITSIAKTLGAPSVSETTLAIAAENLEGVTVVSDGEAVEEMIFILERLKVLTEPAASCTLAAAKRLRTHFRKESRVVLILCGGNTGVRDLCKHVGMFC